MTTLAQTERIPNVIGNTAAGTYLAADNEGQSHESWNIAYARSLSESRARELCRRGAAELISLGLADAVLEDPVLDSARVIWVEDGDGSPIGAIAFSYDYEEDEISIELTYVDPQHRRQGVYSMMYRKLLAVAAYKRVKCIVGGVHKRNDAMLRAAASSGRSVDECAWPSEPYVKVVDYL
jgi:ribosomal protein S18 acetylase RimI-like enzyme